MSDEKQRCKTCLFFLSGGNKAKPWKDIEGVCRRYAPQGATVSPEYGYWIVFPPMDPDQWCGDYKQARPDGEFIAPVWR